MSCLQPGAHAAALGGVLGAVATQAPYPLSTPKGLGIDVCGFWRRGPTEQAVYRAARPSVEAIAIAICLGLGATRLGSGCLRMTVRLRAPLFEQAVYRAARPSVDAIAIAICLRLGATGLGSSRLRMAFWLRAPLFLFHSPDVIQQPALHPAPLALWLPQLPQHPPVAFQLCSPAYQPLAAMPLLPPAHAQGC